MLVAGIIIVVVSVLGFAMMATGHHPDQTRAKRLAEMTPEQREGEQERRRRSNLGVTGRMVEDWQYQEYAARRKRRERFRKQYDAQRKREHVLPVRACAAVASGMGASDAGHPRGGTQIARFRHVTDRQADNQTVGQSGGY